MTLSQSQQQAGQQSGQETGLVMLLLARALLAVMQTQKQLLTVTAMIAMHMILGLLSSQQ
jgi:hypothetical protein